MRSDKPRVRGMIVRTKMNLPIFQVPKGTVGIVTSMDEFGMPIVEFELGEKFTTSPKLISWNRLVYVG